MRTRKSTLELTPLLDVVLIILFAFLMMLTSQINQSTKAKEDADEQVADMQTQLEDAQSGLSDAENEIVELKEDYNRLLQSSALTSEQLEKQKAISDEQQETAENLAKAIAEFIDADKDDLEKLLDENDAPSDETLESITSTEAIAEELLKYEALSRQFYFIDVELKTKDNRLYVNDKSTSVGISLSDFQDDDNWQEKIDDIKNLIEEDMEKRQGGSQMVFITLKVHDREVYQFAWEAVWEAIGDIQEKYGTDKIFRTHITIIKN